MATRRSWALTVLLFVSCSPQPDEMNVETVISRIDALNGKTVSVAGYLGECGGYECALYRTKRDADLTNHWMRNSRAGRPFEIVDVPTLGIGTGANFDATAAPFTNSYVVIKGIVTNECRFNGKPACTDRSTDLKPVSIRSKETAAN
jgi:hypothetical protein